MGMRDYDVVVVGGGPAGCMAAKYAAKAGASTLIVEDDAEIGEPVQCAGLISTRAIKESELGNRNSFIQCEIQGAVVYSPSYDLTLESPTQRAFAIRRDVFDREFAMSVVLNYLIQPWFDKAPITLKVLRGQAYNPKLLCRGGVGYSRDRLGASGVRSGRALRRFHRCPPRVLHPETVSPERYSPSAQWKCPRFHMRQPAAAAALHRSRR